MLNNFGLLEYASKTNPSYWFSPFFNFCEFVHAFSPFIHTCALLIKLVHNTSAIEYYHLCLIEEPQNPTHSCRKSPKIGNQNLFTPKWISLISRVSSEIEGGVSRPNLQDINFRTWNVIGDQNFFRSKWLRKLQKTVKNPKPLDFGAWPLTFKMSSGQNVSRKKFLDSLDLHTCQISSNSIGGFSRSATGHAFPYWGKK